MFTYKHGKKERSQQDEKLLEQAKKQYIRDGLAKQGFGEYHWLSAADAHYDQQESSLIALLTKEFDQLPDAEKQVLVDALHTSEAPDADEPSFSSALPGRLTLR